MEIASAASGQSDLRTATATQIRENSPYARCFACLGVQLSVAERMVRDVAQVLIVHNGFVLDRRVCYTCRHVGEIIVPAEDAG
jgi:hypothetical protein